MKHVRYLTLVMVMIINACSDDDAPPPKDSPYLKLAVSSNLSGVNNLWAFVTDSKGNVIATKKLTVGSIVFEGVAPDVINLTLLEAYPNTTQGQYTFTTYPDIAKNSTVPLVQSNGGWYSPGNSVGAAQVNVTNYTKAAFDYASVYVSDGYAYSLTNDVTPSLKIRLDLHRITVDALLTSHTDLTHPVYAWINGIKNEDTPSIDYTSFKPFEKTISLPAMTDMSAYILGYKTAGTDKKCHMLSHLAYFGNPTAKVSTLGYMEGYDSYETVVNKSTGISGNRAKNTGYFKTGTLNASITLPDYNMTISNGTMQAFDYDYTGNSPFQIHKWGYVVNTDFVRWQVYSTGASVTAFTSIPQELVTQYPILDFSKLKYAGSTFYHATNNYSYLDYFNDWKMGKYPFTNPEYYQVDIIQY